MKKPMWTFPKNGLKQDPSKIRNANRNAKQIAEEKKRYHHPTIVLFCPNKLFAKELIIFTIFINSQLFCLEQGLLRSHLIFQRTGECRIFIFILSHTTHNHQLLTLTRESLNRLWHCPREKMIYIRLEKKCIRLLSVFKQSQTLTPEIAKITFLPLVWVWNNIKEIA
jgi:hypothetical protein